MNRPGYYVEGRHYGVREAQALARASHLASTYGRPVDIRLREFGGKVRTVQTVIRRQEVPS